LARSPRPFGVRAFALTVLAGAGGGAGAEARGLLETCLREDTDEAVRDLAARLLGNLPADDGSLAQLARASAADTAWRVRYSAVEALAASGRSAAVLPALRAASADADERVATRAKELLRRLEAR
jgi:HEAT repeat protein